MDASKLFSPAFRLKVDGRALAPEQVKAVSNVSVTREAGTSGRFSATLANPYPSLPWTHGPESSIFELGSSVSVEMGYVDDLHAVFHGEVTDLRPNFPADGAASLEVEGHTRLHRLGRLTRTQSFKGMTDSDIAARIAQQEGLTADCEATTLQHVEVLQCNRTNLDFLQERASLIGFDLSVDDRKLVFRRPEPGGKSVDLLWGEALRSFRPRLTGLGPVTEVVVRGYDAATAKAIVGRAGAGDELQVLGTDTAARTIEAAFGQRSETIVDRQPRSQAEAESMASAVFNERALTFITGTGEVVGTPELAPGTLVDIKGLGRKFDGRYRLTRTTHAIGDNGYTTQFSARRNAAS